MGNKKQKKLKRRVHELEVQARVDAALYRIAQAASTVTDMQEFYAAMHGIVGELMDASNFYIALYDEARQMINFPYYVDEVDLDIPDPNVWEPFGVGNARGTTAYVLRTGESLLTDDDAFQELVATGEVEVVGQTGQDWLGVPLKSGSHTLGVLVVQTYTADKRLTRADSDILTFVGEHIATALERTRLINETRQRSAELTLVNDVQRGLAERLEMQAMYDLVGDRIQEIFDAQVVDIGIVDPDSGMLHFPYTIERGVRFPDEPMELIGLRRRALQTREPRDRQRRRGAGLRRIRPAVRHRWGATEVLRVRSADRRRPRDRRDLSAEPRPRARVQRRGRAAPDHARREPQRRARERPVVRGDPPAEQSSSH